VLTNSAKGPSSSHLRIACTSRAAAGAGTLLSHHIPEDRHDRAGVQAGSGSAVCSRALVRATISMRRCALARASAHAQAYTNTSQHPLSMRAVAQASERIHVRARARMCACMICVRASLGLTLHSALRRAWTQIDAPPHSLQRERMRLCTQIADPAHSAHAILWARIQRARPARVQCTAGQRCVHRTAAQRHARGNTRRLLDHGQGPSQAHAHFVYGH
jgi:hypothetical protein